MLTSYDRRLRLRSVVMVLVSFLFVVLSVGCTTHSPEESKPKVMTGHARRGTGRTGMTPGNQTAQ